MAVIEKLVVEGGSGGPWRVGVGYEKHTISIFKIIWKAWHCKKLRNALIFVL